MDDVVFSACYVRKDSGTQRFFCDVVTEVGIPRWRGDISVNVDHNHSVPAGAADQVEAVAKVVGAFWTTEEMQQLEYFLLRLGRQRGCLPRVSDVYQDTTSYEGKCARCSPPNYGSGWNDACLTFQPTFHYCAKAYRGGRAYAVLGDVQDR